ncbi:flagellar hook-associated protein FlgK [Sedimentimonas flavescens]|uniref:Flagellar hook-associated protein 1 n=1 Tax=Sedimentimonas flavescens TaxID=2851012 RepID=A0ABT3A1E3_9RHOB|nr:flagellar hook-associated protein FlgK [Sedimentimonas flavescens]MCV2879817.1 flagellar hook-associated protein FlgK [Sedimentimonas flavescens]
MGISTSLSNALSGLNAAARMADVVASNTANALTEGYARRELSLSAQSLGGVGAGVQIDGVVRVVNEGVLQDRRLADAAASNATTRVAFLESVEQMIGAPGEAGSLSARLSGLEAAFVQAASQPESEARLATVLDAATKVAGQMNTMSASVGQMRQEADAQIAEQVEALNQALSQIDDLNAQILAQRAAGHDATALMDQRQALVDLVAEIVPIRQVTRDNNQVALFTTGGAVLLEDIPVRVGFSATGAISADMSYENGDLSGLTLNGMAISPGDDGVMGGGRLGALFAVRDELAPQAQSRIDAIARDLIERFADPATDPTLASGAAGLFTDGSGSFDPAFEAGLAGRIAVNAAVDPERGGALWRLRDGIGASAPGPVGASGQLTALAEALGRGRVPASGDFGAASRSASGLAAELLSQVSSDRLTAQSIESYSLARQEALTELSLADGVDSDYELQMLLRVEQAYAANAKVIQTVDTLIQQLLGL